MRAFLKVLINCAIKAANIARVIRSENELFTLLIQEKTLSDKNPRFVRDFKTLADVLIQESLRHEISSTYPEITNNICGEESNTFMNSIGESIKVKVEENEEKTALLLSRVLNGNTIAAKILAKEVHRHLDIEDEDISIVPITGLIDSFTDIGIWIDPIDGTNEYIKGQENSKCDETEIANNGLQCVTVLIGAFNLKSGQPFVGVLNQPFWKYDNDEKKWTGRNYWGITMKHEGKPQVSFSSESLKKDFLISQNEKKTIVMSSSEDKILQSKLISNGKFNLIFSSGAGYKLMAVTLGLADLYILSKNTTHFWDTCAPHSILNSIGGGILNFQKALTLYSKNSEEKAIFTEDILYSLTDEKAKLANFSNIGGVLAYRNVNAAIEALDCLCLKH